MKRVAVTGCSGFVGGAIALELHNRGYQVRGGYRDRKPAVPYDTVQGNLCEPAAAGRLLEGCDTVFHAAALVGTLNYKRDNPATIASVNIQTTLNVLDGCIRANVGRCVFLSSTEIYGQHGVATEEDGFLGNPDSKNDGYVWSKRYGEIALDLFSRQFGLKWSAIRLDNIYGPGERDAKSLRAIPAMIEKALAGEDLVVWGDGSQERSFLYIDDAVEGIVASARDEVENGPINLSSPERISILDLAKLIIELTGGHAGMVLDSTRPAGPHVRTVGVEKARRILGFSPKVELKEGVRRCVAAFGQNHATP